MRNLLPQKEKYLIKEEDSPRDITRPNVPQSTEQEIEDNRVQVLKDLLGD